jgi:hypothetical protein
MRYSRASDQRKRWRGTVEAGQRRTLRPRLLDLEDRRLPAPLVIASTRDDGSTGTPRWAISQANQATSPATMALDLGISAAAIMLQ